MQECMASWAHIFADFSWWVCLMIFVAGFNDKYKKRIDLWGSGGPPAAVEPHSARPSAVATLSTPRGLGLVLSLPPGQ